MTVRKLPALSEAPPPAPDPLVAAAELRPSPVDLAAVSAAVGRILAAVGEDPDREGLVGTPGRVARAYDELLSGYRADPHALLNGALYDEPCEDMVLVRDIRFHSLCEHHLLPFHGRVHVAYLPRGRVIGLSKIPRVVDMFARRLQIQERFARQVGDFLEAALNPRGLAVVVEGHHMCASMRGVRKDDADMVTRSLRGAFADNESLRRELMMQLAAPRAGA